MKNKLILTFLLAVGFLQAQENKVLTLKDAITFAFDTTYFAKYKKDLESNVEHMNKNRLNLLENWFTNIMKTEKRNDTLLAFYPFSGGDFLHFYHVFPKATNYVMMAIEPVGSLPDFESMSVEKKNEYLANLNFTLRDIFKRSYFITKNMNSDINKDQIISGMLPPILWAVGITGHEIIDILDAEIDSTGNITNSAINGNAHKFKKGVTIVFRNNTDQKEKRVSYFAYDISDEGLTKNEPLKLYLDKMPSYNSFLKAASYLAHYNSFSIIRNNLLDKSANLLQDDTGIPYKHFAKNTFDAQLYGLYTQPVNDFSKNLFQKDLEEAYNDSTIYCGKLPFSMGYHWGTKYQNQMVFMRK